MAHGLGDGIEQGVADDAEVGGDAVAEGSRALLLIERNRQFHQVGEDVAAQPVERGLAGADEALDAEEGNHGLHGEHADEHEHDVVGFLQNLGGIDTLAEGVGGISDELLEEIRKRQREDGGEEERGERGQENRLFLHQITEDPSVG